MLRRTAISVLCAGAALFTSGCTIWQGHNYTLQGGNGLYAHIGSRTTNQILELYGACGNNVNCLAGIMGQVNVGGGLAGDAWRTGWLHSYARGEAGANLHQMQLHKWYTGPSYNGNPTQCLVLHVPAVPHPLAPIRWGRSNLGQSGCNKLNYFMP